MNKNLVGVINKVISPKLCRSRFCNGCKKISWRVSIENISSIGHNVWYNQMIGTERHCLVATIKGDFIDNLLATNSKLILSQHCCQHMFYYHSRKKENTSPHSFYSKASKTGFNLQTICTYSQLHLDWRGKEK